MNRIISTKTIVWCLIQVRSMQFVAFNYNLYHAGLRGFFSFLPSHIIGLAPLIGRRESLNFTWFWWILIPDSAAFDKCTRPFFPISSTWRRKVWESWKLVTVYRKHIGRSNNLISSSRILKANYGCPATRLLLWIVQNIRNSAVTQWSATISCIFQICVSRIRSSAANQ